MMCVLIFFREQLASHAVVPFQCRDPYAQRDQTLSGPASVRHPVHDFMSLEPSSFMGLYVHRNHKAY